MCRISPVYVAVALVWYGKSYCKGQLMKKMWSHLDLRFEEELSKIKGKEFQTKEKAHKEVQR